MIIVSKIANLVHNKNYNICTNFVIIFTVSQYYFLPHQNIHLVTLIIRIINCK